MRNKKSATNLRFGGISKDERIIKTQHGPGTPVSCRDCVAAQDKLYAELLFERTAQVLDLNTRLEQGPAADRTRIQHELDTMPPRPKKPGYKLYSKRELKTHRLATRH